MPSLFYLYTFIYIANKIYYLLLELFSKKPDDHIEVDLANANLADLWPKAFSFNSFLSILNFIWILIGIFGKHETMLFCLLLFIDLVSISSMFSKNNPAADKKYYIITLIIKIAIAGFIIYTHFFNNA